MPALPPRPDFDQLRRRARELLEAASSDPVANAKFLSVDLPPTLTTAQLLVARDHGFASWSALKRAVEQRTSGPAARFVLRRIASSGEQDAVLDLLGDQFGRPAFHASPRVRDLRDSFSAQRPLRLLVTRGGDLAGGVIARFGPPSRAFGLQIIALVPDARGIGIGRRLYETVEMEAMALGAGWITVGGVALENRGFYRQLGFRGKHSTMQKGLPLPGRVRDLRLQRMRAAVGDLDAGLELVPDPATGKVPPLRWLP